MLLKRNITINSYLAHVFKVFEDFKLIDEIRKELDTLKDPIASYIPATTEIPYINQKTSLLTQSGTLALSTLSYCGV